VLVAPDGDIRELAVRLEFRCTNNQAEYEALMAELETLIVLEVKDVEVFGDSNLVVQQVRGDSQCLDGVLNEYRELCVDMIKKMDPFHIQHISRRQKKVANELAQQASGYEVNQGKFLVKKRPAICCEDNMCTKRHETAIENSESDIKPGDWRYVIRECIRNPSDVRDRKT
jgi:ribonuclease HI